jgi:Tfp pilus assembly protein FimV
MASITPTPSGAALPAPGWSAPLAAPAVPTIASPSSAAAGSAIAAPNPAPAWTPEPPPARPTTRSGDVRLVSTPPAAGRQIDEQVVVRLGDTLWEVAARHLGRDAGPAEIAHEWPRWYAANRSVIGHDPDLLLPGQRLTPPASSPATSPTAGTDNSSDGHDR